MVIYIILAFIAGGLFGMMGMAILAYGPKNALNRENRFLREELHFLIKGEQRKKYQPVHDPRPQVHSMVN